MDEIKIKQKAFSNPELTAFCGQLSLILHSGISSLEGISILLEDSKDPEERRCFRDCWSALQETGSLATAFADAGPFPRLSSLQDGARRTDRYPGRGHEGSVAPL